MTSHSNPQVSKDDTLHLYTYFRSSCSARLRIATALKSLPVTHTYINLLSSAQSAPSYTAINPSASVPTLEVRSRPDDTVKIRITQSLAALEFLDEAFPDTVRLLPADVGARAVVRTLSNIIASDVQPVTNLRILKRVRGMGGDGEAWARELITAGLMAYEAICRDTAGKYSVGATVTMADCCLVPAVWGAQRVGVEFGEMPVLWGVFERLSLLEEVRRSHWKMQEDTPEELRG